MISNLPDPETDLTPWLEAIEDESVEFKAARSSFSTDELCRYISAISNGEGGYIFFGITDKRPKSGRDIRFFFS